jgi:lysophospholipase L1-like esterase
MKTILCFGDSLTWGYSAETLGRHNLEDRWPSALRSALGDGFQVIAEGLNGRTTVFDDHMLAGDLNGARVLPTLLASHSPLDLVVIMLGSNDMKPWVNGTARGAARGMKRLVEIIRSHPYAFEAPAPRVVLVSPPLISATDNADFAEMFAGGISSSGELAKRYEEVADETGCGFFDAATVAKTTPLDGVHLDAENTRAIGRALAPVVRTILGGKA